MDMKVQGSVIVSRDEHSPNDQSMYFNEDGNMIDFKEEHSVKASYCMNLRDVGKDTDSKFLYLKNAAVSISVTGYPL